ncbi:MAG: endolytic transglycosylase MltG [Hyphomicrobiaceae bacterium]
MRGFTRFLSGILTLGFVVMISVAGVVAWFHQSVHAPGPLQETRSVIIPAGDSSRMIAERLEKQGVISGQSVFLAQVMSQNAIARFSGRPGRHMKAGEYEIESGASIRDVIDKLTEGRSLLYSVTMPEGLTSYEIVRRLLKDDNLSGAVSQVPAEGSLLPETFRVPRNTPRQQVLTLLAKEQTKFLNAKWEGRAPDLPLRNQAEALVLASLVEKESGPNDDPAKIAGVFINRLRRRIRLQSDPTILYGKHGPKVAWGAKIFRSDINRKTAYNTYQIDGLPPTPICNPGRRAIEAVLQPAETKDLYFVADGRGGHIFSATLKDHERAVKNWRKIERGIRASEANRAKQQKAAASGNVAPTLLNTKSGSSSVTVASGTDNVAASIVPLPVKRPPR